MPAGTLAGRTGTGSAAATSTAAWASCAWASRIRAAWVTTRSPSLEAAQDLRLGIAHPPEPDLPRPIALPAPPVDIDDGPPAMLQDGGARHQQGLRGGDGHQPPGRSGGSAGGAPGFSRITRTRAVRVLSFEAGVDEADGGGQDLAGLGGHRDLHRLARRAARPGPARRRRTRTTSARSRRSRTADRWS